MAGFVYIMSNAAFSGLLKIGQTNRDPEVYRTDELDTTGVPEPFKVEFYVFSDNYQKLELLTHEALKDYRPNSNKEFFRCSIPKAIKTIREIGGDAIKFEKLNYVFLPKPKPRKKRKKRMNAFEKALSITPRQKGETIKAFDARVKLEQIEQLKIAKAIGQGRYVEPRRKGETHKEFDVRVRKTLLRNIRVSKENRLKKKSLG